MSMSARIKAANARSRRVPSLLLNGLLAWFLSAIILAVLVPALAASGRQLSAWMVWAVILASFALCVGPDLWTRSRRRR